MVMFSSALLAWYDEHKRDLPWRASRDPYAIWVSEIMLQQTQVETVKPYYFRWLERFPTPQHLAAANPDDVLKLWEGLGYYSRARNMQKAAQIICEAFNASFPDTYETVRKLPGVGDYTAGAILSIAFDQPYPAVDGNVMRVLSRVLDIEFDITKPASKVIFQERARSLIPEGRAGDFNQALMELGACICTPSTPSCDDCPLSTQCEAFRLGLQKLRPVKTRKAPPVPVTAMTALIRDEAGRLLITKRQETGLMAGLWQTPTIELPPAPSGAPDPEILRDRLQADGILISRPIQLLGSVEHTFTHRQWRLYVYEARIISEPPDAQWMTPSDRSGRAFSVLHQKAIALLDSLFAQR